MVIRSNKGYSIMELLAVTALSGVLISFAASNIKELEDPLADAGFQVSYYLKLARSRAISQTLSIEVSAESATALTARAGDSCAGSMSALDDLSLTLPAGTQLGSTDWSVCFSQRGLADESVSFSVRDGEGRLRTIEVALGGGVRIR